MNTQKKETVQNPIRKKQAHAVILDYGMGNIFSLKRAVSKIGITAVVSGDPEKILAADYLLLPGVGAFPVAMKNLEKKNLIEPIIDFVRQGRPLMGICLGMQLLLSKSQENIETNGLDLISGEVKKLFDQMEEPMVKLPHFGWNGLSMKKTSHDTWRQTIFNGLENDDGAYFVHSYVCCPEDRQSILSTTVYGKERFCSAVQKDNIMGCQFHPELSGPSGLKILASFFNNF